MTETGFGAGRLFALPFELRRPWETEEAAGIRSGTILDHIAQHAYWFAAPVTPDEAKAITSLGLFDRDTRAWEIYEGADLSGLLLLTRIVPSVDALLHFTLWRTNLFAARKLILSFLTRAFEEWGFQRLSMEVPEHAKGMLPFARQKLGFRFEGEPSTSNHRIALHLESDSAKKHGVLTHEAGQWLAKQGSRRENAHWDPKTQRYRDVHLLRLLRAEHLNRTLPAPERATSVSEEPSEVHEPRPETSPVFSVHPT